MSVPFPDKSHSPLSGMGEGAPLQMEISFMNGNSIYKREIYALLLGRKGEGRVVCVCVFFFSPKSAIS